ncbi:MAG: peptide ABC transporter substrate-binding protein [Treponema sp.]|jgi:peptide/nickel transport system substrate-binding protein/oligopeptide transport system substrate-binding protein|nr:peptide ABC transporter substrate-binding protein [Treponema sp.]
MFHVPGLFEVPPSALPKARFLALIFAVLVVAGCKNSPEPLSGQMPEERGSSSGAPEPNGGEASPLAPQPSPKGEGSPLEGPGYAETRPRSIIRDELTVVFSKGELELDFRKSYLAGEAQLYTGLYEGLFSYHPLTMEPVSAAAEKWELSEDKKQWTFSIRKDSRYWNGDPLRAQDFRNAWLSLLEPVRESPYSSLFDIIEGAKDYRTGLLTDPEKVGIETPDDNTLVVRLNSPASFFSSMLCHHSFSPIHPSMINRDNWLSEAPLSNGPFKVEKLDDTELVLEKNLHYWDAGRVALNRIRIRFTETGEEASNLWNSGEARWVSGDVALETLTDRSGIRVNPMFATHYYFFRQARKPWDDHRIRRALALALPWMEIREGSWLPAETLIFPLPGYPRLEGITEANLEESRKLLSDAGYSEGKGLPELVIRLTPSREAARIGGLMAQTWKEQLGVPVRVEVIPYAQYWQSLKSGNYEIGSSTWIGDFADPYTFLQMWRRDSNLNDACLNDTDYEELMERSMAEEGEKRLETLAAAEKLLLDRGSVLPISYSPAINIIDLDEIDGWFPNPLDIHPFRYLSFKSYRPLPGVAMAK